MTSEEILNYELKHGIRLTICNTSGQLTVREVADFLAEALNHFKHQRDYLKATIYTDGPYTQTAKHGRMVRETMQLSCATKEGLPLELWIDSVIDAYSRTNTLEQMLDDIPTWQMQTAGEPEDYLRGIVHLVTLPDGGLSALAEMLKRSISQPRQAFKSIIRRLDGEQYVPVGNVHCRLSAELFCRLTGRQLSESAIAQYTPIRLQGVAADATFLAFGKAPVSCGLDICPEARELARRLIDYFPRIPQDAGDHPVLLGISPQGEFIASVSNVKPG